MQVRFWGTRGSIATPGPQTAEYGGNTSCVEVRTDAGDLFVLDCGTGARTWHLVLMDMEMPVMDGYTVTRVIREWERAKGLPPGADPRADAYALAEERAGVS